MSNKLWVKIFFKGDKVRCNLCGNTFSHFRNTGYVKRKNALCPECHSTEASRTLWFYLSNEVLGKKNKTNFLCFSTPGVIVNKLKAASVTVEEKQRNYFDLLSENHVPEKLKGGFFDVILFPHVIQFVKSEEQTFEELHRLLRPGGFVLIMTVVNWDMDRVYESPKTATDRVRLAGYYEPGIERVYGANFHKHLERAGFKVEIISYPEQLGPHAHNYYRLGNGAREMIYKCKK